MPIYAYKCGSCGHGQDVLQKISDPLLTRCPQCGAESLTKQVTAAGFQLKGSGWYVTDFRGGANGAPKDAKADGEGAKASGDAKPEKTEKAADKTPDASTSKSSDKPASTSGDKASAKPASAAPAGSSST